MGKKTRKQLEEELWSSDAPLEELEVDRTAEDLDQDGHGLMAIVKDAAKKRKEKSAAKLAAEEDVFEPPLDVEVPEIKIKSKKEKEREKKERMKEEKKNKSQSSAGQKLEDVVGDDVSSSAAKPIRSKKQFDSSAPSKDSANSTDGTDTPAPPLSDSQATTVPSDLSATDFPSPPISHATKAKSSKKKVPSATISALRDILASKQAQEEQDRCEEEQRVKIERERLEKIEAEEAEKRETKERKKERERLRKEQLKKEGKYFTEAERKRRQLDQLKLEQLRSASNLAVPSMPSNHAAPVESIEEKKENLNSKSNANSSGKRIVYKNLNKKRVVPVKIVDAPSTDATESMDATNATDAAIELENEVAESWEDAEISGDDDLLVLDQTEAVDGVKSEESVELDIGHPTSTENETQTAEEVESARVKAEAKLRREERLQKAMDARTVDNLRSPICVILGHVDTGKTKLLDKEGEAGGITQQIGATYFPTDAIKTKTQRLLSGGGATPDSATQPATTFHRHFSSDFEFQVPGLLVIDTPGHESFANLRSRGSSLCNIAILVVDLMHGLEPQTIESINLLKSRKTPFIVALNKIDRIYGWEAHADFPVLETLSLQSAGVIKEFESRVSEAKVALASQGLNAELYHRNVDVRRFVSIVPTSAVTGEGVPDLLMLLVQLTQERLTDSLMYLSELEATVLEVKMIEGHGTTIDVILSNGVLREGDRIVLCGLNGPIVTSIRALLTPQPMRELRVKGSYVHHKEIKAAMGVKIAAPDLEKAIAGSRLLVVTADDNEEELKEEVMDEISTLFDSLDPSGRGVCVQASTLGSLEALLSFLNASKIPIAGINLGPVFKKDVLRASVMHEHQKEYATILAFDVKIDKEIQELADSMQVKIFQAEIIYHLFDQFTKYLADIQEQKRKDLTPQAVWPCWLKIVPGCVFNKKEPIILGVDVVEGSLRLGTPLCVPARGGVSLGVVRGMEINHKPVTLGKKGQQVAVRIEQASYESTRIFGRHFGERDDIVSKISRQSIDILKDGFRSEVSMEEWQLIRRLKPLLLIE